MTKINYSSLSVLVADDFSNFRNTVSAMLQNLGIVDVEMAGMPDEIIACCERRSFDLVLCDYNLGHERTGQHVLEELRYKKLLTSKTVFIMVSAEASRNIVMSAYDCQPDDYLMKPITAKMLQQRMDRLLIQRRAFSHIYAFIDAGDRQSAIDQLIDMSLEENRYAIAAQKLLGQLFFEEGMLDNAEKLYTKALEVRTLDWARLGLARVKQARGDLELAGTWLETIINENPLYLPAYDSLADNWEKKGEGHHMQFTVQQAVDISPMSILRQKKLGDVAQQNNDMATSISALRSTVKLGAHSCYGNAGDHFAFARTVSLALERKLDIAPDIANEAIQVLKIAEERYELDESQAAQSFLLEGRLCALEGRRDEAETLLARGAELLEGSSADISAQLDKVAALLALGKKAEAQELLKALKELYGDDEAALELLDEYLDEPASESNRALVAAVNREGIELYNEGRFDEALDCFERARKLFPKHIGIQLNIVQAYVGKMRAGVADDLTVNECSACIELVASLIDEANPQYDRYLKLKNMATTSRECI